MIAKDGSDVEEATLGEETTLERGAHTPAKPGDLLNLLSRFLESQGNVLLVRGAPGTGKTTLALGLLFGMKGTRIGPHTISPNQVYVSTRVSSTKLRRHFPGVQEVIDSMSGRQATGNRREIGDANRAGAANIIER